MKRVIFCTVLLFFAKYIFSQNVGINPSGTTPDASSLLDLNTGNTFASPNGKGLIIPNVSLTNSTDVTTIANPANSLLVYNTNAAMTNGNGAGYYYYNTAAAKWMYLNAASNAPGTNGQVLTTQGPGVAPQWQNAATTSGSGFMSLIYNDEVDGSVAGTTASVKTYALPANTYMQVMAEAEVFGTGGSWTFTLKYNGVAVQVLTLNSTVGNNTGGVIKYCAPATAAQNITIDITRGASGTNGTITGFRVYAIY